MKRVLLLLLLLPLSVAAQTKLNIEQQGKVCTANQYYKTNAGATLNECTTISVGTAGTDFAVVFGAGTTTFNLPDASGTNRGAVTTGTQTFAGAKTFSSGPTVSGGNLDFSSTGQRFTADFSNATLTNRFYFQSNTTNGNTAVGLLPNGTATVSQLNVFANATPTNAVNIQLQATGTRTRLTSTAAGAGSPQQLDILVGATASMEFDTSNNVNVPNGTLSVGGTNVMTFSKSITVLVPTTTEDDYVQWMHEVAVTYTDVDCSTDVGTVTIDMDHRVITTPNTVGTDILTGTIVCDTDNQADGGFADATIPANVPVNLSITATASSPQAVRIHIRGTID